MNSKLKKIIIGAAGTAVIAGGALTIKQTSKEPPIVTPTPTVMTGQQPDALYKLISDINAEHKKAKAKKGKVSIPFNDKSQGLLEKIKSIK